MGQEVRVLLSIVVAVVVVVRPFVSKEIEPLLQQHKESIYHLAKAFMVRITSSTIPGSSDTADFRHATHKHTPLRIPYGYIESSWSTPVGPALEKRCSVTSANRQRWFGGRKRPLPIHSNAATASSMASGTGVAFERQRETSW